MAALAAVMCLKPGGKEMKPLFNGRVTYLLLVMLFAAVGSSSIIAGVKDCDDPKWANHPYCTDTDPEPVDLGSLCADSGSFFPAFAYVFTGEVFLSNSEGDCSISIQKSDDVGYGISYRFFGNLETGDGYGKIVWSRRHFDF